jgi:HAD superfamily hydrolase (TIGR01549 family)
MLDGAKELHSALKGKVKMYIVTNGVEFIQKSRYSLSGLSLYFDGIFISGELGYEKPDPKYFERIEDILGTFSKENTIVIGDSLTSDIKGANNFGLDSCWYNPSKKQPSTVASPTYTAHSFDEVYSVIEKGEI